MNPVALLPDAPLGDGPLARLFVERGARTYREAADYVWRLPYGRNRDRTRPELVLEEGQGTCSSKHALLALLAAEEDLPVELVLGIYLMDGANTPGTGDVLAARGLSAVPEAHCILRANGHAVDLTHPPGSTAGSPITAFLAEEVIAPDQVGEYKQAWHRAYLERWPDRPPAMSAGEIWAAREACIAALATSAP